MSLVIGNDENGDFASGDSGIQLEESQADGQRAGSSDQIFQDGPRVDPSNGTSVVGIV